MRWVLVFVAALAAGLATAADSPARAPGVLVEHRPILERQVLQELNRVRTARGLPKVRAEAGLRRAAHGHSRSMLTLGFFAHDSADGTPYHQRIRRHYPARGFETWSVGETLLSSGGPIDARSIVAAWLASPGHRAIIVSARWREAGVGAFSRTDAPGPFGGTQTLVVTADFGFRAGRRSGA